MKKRGFTILLIFVSMLSSAQGIDRSLFAFDFKMDKLSMPERSQLFAELGYGGVTFAVKNDDQRQKLLAYLDTQAFSSGKLSIPVVYFPFDFDRDFTNET